MSQNTCSIDGFDKRLLVSTVAVVVRFVFDSRLAVSTVTVLVSTIAFVSRWANFQERGGARFLTPQIPGRPNACLP